MNYQELKEHLKKEGADILIGFDAEKFKKIDRNTIESEGVKYRLTDDAVTFMERKLFKGERHFQLIVSHTI